jgi:hypothetical protein
MERKAGAPCLSVVAEDEIHFTVDSEMRVRMYGSDSKMLEIACVLCAKNETCKGGREGLFSECAIPCG